jgi:cysteine-rich repeat protein
MKRVRIISIVLFFVILSQFVSFVSADVISENSGGNKELIINPDTYLEGFFSGDNGKILSSCGNGLVETPYEECDDNNYASGDGCSALCKVESGYICTGEPSVCVLAAECDSTHPCPTGQDCVNGVCKTSQPPEPPAGPGEVYIRVDPTSINKSMLVDSNINATVGITNLNASEINFSVSSSGFDPDLIVNFWDEKNKRWVQSFSLVLPSHGIYELRVRFSAPSQVGIYNGTLNIDGKKVSVSLSVKEKLLLFDSNIIVLNPDYLVPQGDKLRTSVTLIPLGDKERMDVTLNYVIKDYNNRIYLTRSETVLVENQINFKRNFDTGVLPVGSYIVGLELIYPNGVAPSSAHFEVTVGRQSTFFGKLVFFLLNLILIVLILIILLVILRIIRQMIDKKKREEKEKFIDKLNSKDKDKDDNKEKEESKDKEKPKDKEKS